MSALLITADSHLRAEVNRLGAAAGAEVVDTAVEADALRLWSSADVVLVGADLGATVSRLSPPRRERVHLIGPAPLPDLVFRTALAIGAETVSELPESSQWLVELLTDMSDGGRHRGRLIAVVGGSGGVGASVLSAGLAQTLARQAATVLIDADPLGAGADRLLGMESLPGVHWEDLNATTGRLSARALRDSLPRRDRLSVLTWGAVAPTPLQPFAAREVLGAAVRGFAAVVVDLPRHADVVGDDVLARCDDVVLVVGSSVAAASSARRVVARLRGLSARTHVVLRGKGGVRPDDVGRLLMQPVTCVMPDQRMLDESLDLGAGPLRHSRGHLARACQQVAEQIVGQVA